ncbi:MAG: polymer-forming cytoskeletal protein [Chlorobi bacterium]|nr:polymer-forming cytoskeletal protein [Chlorobiota bacterium]
MGKNYDQEISILSNGLKFEGKLTSEGNVRIDGDFTGDIIINGNLTLGDKSIVKGNIKATNITISGKVDGIVEASEKIVLESTSRLIGDLTARILVVNEGSIFDGKSKMNSNNTSVDYGSSYNNEPEPEEEEPAEEES